MKNLQQTSLADYTSMKAGGPADNLVLLEAGDDLPTVIADAQQPVWVLGFGTNSLISDKGLRGTVIINQLGEVEQLSATRLRVSSGLNWDTFVQKTIEFGLWGLELTSGIPGGVGAAVFGNIAAYGQQVADTLVEALIFDQKTGTTITWTNQDFQFEYRHSQLQNQLHLIVLSATFELSPQAGKPLEYDSALKIATELGLQPDTLANRRTIVLEARRRAGALLDDGGAGTAGSFFKNPVVNDAQLAQITAHEEFGIKPQQITSQNSLHGGNSNRVSAAHVLLAAGFQRGQSWGAVRLHPDHILKVENTGQATATEIFNVVQEIIKVVQEKLQITLEPEVRFLGEF